MERVCDCGLLVVCHCSKDAWDWEENPVQLYTFECTCGNTWDVYDP